MTTPEKWDGVTRGWKSRDYVKDTGLVVSPYIVFLFVFLVFLFTNLSRVFRKLASTSVYPNDMGLRAR